MKKIILSLTTSFIALSAQAVTTLTLTHISDPNFQPVERKFIGSQWENWRVPCSKYSPQAAHELCYQKDYVELIEPHQLQTENEIEKNVFEEKLAVLAAKVNFYPTEIQNSHNNLNQEIAANEKFIAELAKQISEDIRKIEGN